MAANEHVFDKSTTGSSVADIFASRITGKTILITGINIKGIGYKAAEALAAHSPKTLILASRTSSKIHEVIDDLRPKFGGVTYIPLELDLSSQQSCRKAASAVMSNSEISQIDILINNAAVMDVPNRQFTPDGIEMQFGTNHIGHFLFTNLIMPKILAAARSNPKGDTRIVNVSSHAVVYSPVRFSDINLEKPHESLPKAEQPGYDELATNRKPVDPKSTYAPTVAYGQSKSANVLFALGLTTRLYEKYGILSFGIHPGVILTELARHHDQTAYAEIVERFKSIFKTLDEGCATTLVAALDHRLGPAAKDGSGIYLSDGQITEAPTWAQNPQYAEDLWALSEKLVGEKFEY